MESIKNNLSNLNNTAQHMTKVMLLMSTILLSSCKDNQMKYSNQKTTIETTTDQIISYEPNTEELGIIGNYNIKVIPNQNWKHSISSNIDSITIDLATLQDYCKKNNMEDIIINENNKIKIVEAIAAMKFKDKLSAEWQEELGLYIFNTMNKSDSENILNACSNNWYHNEEAQFEIITDSIQYNNTRSEDILSLEDQYLEAEVKKYDNSLTEEERKKRSQKYNRLSTEIFKPSQEEITSISDY